MPTGTRETRLRLQARSLRGNSRRDLGQVAEAASLGAWKRTGRPWRRKSRRSVFRSLFVVVARPANGVDTVSSADDVGGHVRRPPSPRRYCTSSTVSLPYSVRGLPGKLVLLRVFLQHYVPEGCDQVARGRLMTGQSKKCSVSEDYAGRQLVMMKIIMVTTPSIIETKRMLATII